jgi:hypothetical protein
VSTRTTPDTHEHPDETARVTMSDDEEFDDDEVVEEIEELDLDEDLVEDDLELDDDLVAIDEDLDETPVDGVVAATDATTAATDEDDDEEGLDLDEELHPDDVEAPLDALLQERTAKATLEDEEEEVEDDDVDVDERGEATTRIVPRRPGEFLCQSCFLVLPRHMLADEERMLCQDCV